MKYVIRRSIVALIASPIVASAYVLFYAFLILAGGMPTTNLAGAWGNGWLVAISTGIVFIAIGKWSDK